MPRRYTAETALTTATITIDSVASTAFTAVSSEISNDAASERYPYMELELVVGTTSARAAGAFVGVYIIPEVDDTNYPDTTTATSANEFMNNYYIGSLALDAATTARRLTMRGIDLPPSDFKIALYNGMGVAFGASGNSLKYRMYSDEYTTS